MIEQKVGAAMIVGGGIGGIQAALDLAESGIKVYLVEKDSAIGGIMSRLDKTFPTNDCAMCTLAPRLVSVGKHKDIEILTLSDVLKVEGEEGNFKVNIKKKQRFIIEDLCTACGECSQVCPIEHLSEFNEGLSKEKVIYKHYPQAVPSAYAIRKEGEAPCIYTCPISQKAQGYIKLISERRYEDAFKIIVRDNPFPSICGRACFHPCEEECLRGNLDEPVAIRELKRFVVDWAYENNITEKFFQPVPKIYNEKIAVVGSGPAGLTYAFDLAKYGYPVTVFEKEEKAGGLMAWAIPEYRLPRNIIEKDVENIKRVGVEIITNKEIRDPLELLREGYKAVFISIGCQKGLKLGIEGESAEGVMDAMEFLKQVSLGKFEKIGKKVGIIGGGNSAIDAARVALRLGAEEVNIIYRRSRNEMPASAEEIEDAEKEGINIIFLTAPKKIIVKDGKVIGIECLKMKLGEPDASGRRKPIPIEGSEYVIELDNVIAAISQEPEEKYLSSFKITKWKTLEIDSDTLMTNIEGVFAGGDVVRGPKSIVEAISDGHKAAENTHKYLRGIPIEKKEKKETVVKLTLDQIKQRAKSKEKRVIAPSIDLEKRKKTFDEVYKRITEEQALKEAKRCLECGICCECLLCVEACLAKAINHNLPAAEEKEIQVGAIIIAPGFKVFDPSGKEDLGYKKFANVVTSIEFERILSASGCYSGEVLRPGDLKHPKKIAFIQCVGSREKERDWCSSVCCMYATKEAIIAKEHAGADLQCDIYFMDVRAFSKGFEQYYESAKKQGIKYIRCRVPKLEENPENKNIIVTYLGENDKKLKEEYDMVVLSVGLCPPSDAKEISEKFGIELNEFGFASTSVFKPVETNRKGVFVAGPFTEPKDIPETVMQATASASKAMSVLADVRGQLIKPLIFPEEIDVKGQEPRIGVFICHCGTNIAGVVNVEEVTEYAKTLENVVFATHNMYTCSNDTQVLIKEKIKEFNLNRVVVASCTPRTHEPLFRNTLKEAGLNPYLFEMANIRDQNSWVHMQFPDAATKKAKDLVRMAVAKARLLEPLQNSYIDIIKNALVIGGGIAGMKASLELAKQGYKVYLLEKTGDLGGNLRNIHYLLNGENPREELEKVIREVKENKNIEIYFNAKIEEVEGSVGRYKTKIKSNGNEFVLNHGVVIIAMGGKEYEPKEYMYGEDERVLTQRQLEEKIAKKEIKLPETVVMIQCVGSREGERPSCSRICCGTAIKNALKIKEISPKTNVFVLYRDVRAYGFKEKYYTMARDKGVTFIRWDIEDGKPSVYKNNGKLYVDVKDKILNMEHTIPADLVVLSTGVMPNEDHKEVAQHFKVPVTAEGYFLEAHMKLRPVDFATDGVFLAGLAHFPKTIDESIIQAQASAARAATILSKDKLELEATISRVIDENCDGCAYCVDTCPFKALTLLEYVFQGSIKKTVEANESLCKGCGTCMATCPKKGILVKGFTLEQLQAQVFAALEQS